MKSKLINALLDVPLALLLVTVPKWAGLLMIAVYVVNKTFELPKMINVNGRKRKIIN
ncbi:hypothetical protein [Enterococcus wangshanyuanii]|uniref:Uncharacterized protein n=1 Tax=Enterococcus wangshanyuanii TaxID=2005703 RepID=A0ABQ1PXM5_9ENTE|nr:hypothetical protein [Enterococcus wangshanyuanii]GGD06248.1 hypothetical protein GCM10011573_39580 [Enterococcus wangshanyuanii]